MSGSSGAERQDAIGDDEWQLPLAAVGRPPNLAGCSRSRRLDAAFMTGRKLRRWSVLCTNAHRKAFATVCVEVNFSLALKEAEVPCRT